tara:strand:+ start:136 stop:786 length:651 start_codon:yes stop_codon:yes gene_type:complete
MHKIKSLLIVIYLFSLSLFSQEDLPFFYLDESNVSIYSENKGKFKEMHVSLKNDSDKSVVVHFPNGGVFVNGNDAQQDLVVVISDNIKLAPGKSSDIKIYTVCASPGKQAPNYGNDSWTYSFDERIEPLLTFYSENRSVVELATGSEFHDTFEKRHNFLQMCVWVFYDAKEKDVLNFATKNLFNNNKERAQDYFDIFYPAAVTFIKLYKGFYSLGK